MNCKRAQSDIALWAGNDLDESDLSELRIHLQVCPGCRVYLEDMRALLRLMEECPLRDEADGTSQRGESLWPMLASRLVSIPAPRTDRFNGWVPAVAVAAVCLAMVLVASPPHLLSPENAPAVSSSAENDWTRGSTASADGAWTIDHSPQAHAISVSPSPAVIVPTKDYQQQRPALPDDLKVIERKFREMERQLRAMERQNFGPLLMQGSGLFAPPFGEGPDPFSTARRSPRP